MTATVQFKPKPLPRPPADFNDPRRRVLSDHHHSLLGINRREEGMAHHLSWEAGMHDELIDALVASRGPGANSERRLKPTANSY